MQGKTITLASIYELQDLKVEALRIYEDILKKDPHNLEAKLGVKRISGLRKKFDGVNENMLNFFCEIKDEFSRHEFERWLVKI